MNEDKIIAEAVRLAKDERHQYEPQTLQSVARHALRLATPPEQDPALVKAMEVWKDAWAVWVDAEAGDDDPDHKAAASVIMKHYHVPDAEAVKWARLTLAHYGSPSDGIQRDAARYILKMAGDTE